MEVFLFPLVNVTLFPKTTKPLNIFEPKYLALFKDAIASKTPVAIGYIEDTNRIAKITPGQNVSYVREVCGYGVPHIIEERTNGTLLVFLQGEGKLKLGKVIDKGQPYIVCEANVITENLVVDPSNKTLMESLHKILIRWVNTHIPDLTQKEIFLRSLVKPEEIIGAFSSYLVRDYDLQQMSLEFNDINEKILFLHRLVESNEITG